MSETGRLLEKKVPLGLNTVYLRLYVLSSYQLTCLLFVFILGFVFALLRKSSSSVVSNSLRPHELQPTRFPDPLDFPGKSTGVGCHFLLHALLNDGQLISPVGIYVCQSLDIVLGQSVYCQLHRQWCFYPHPPPWPSIQGVSANINLESIVKRRELQANPRLCVFTQ